MVAGNLLFINVIVLGRGGLGKTTFLNTLLDGNEIKTAHFINPEDALNDRPVTIIPNTFGKIACHRTIFVYFDHLECRARILRK